MVVEDRKSILHEVKWGLVKEMGYIIPSFWGVDMRQSSTCILICLTIVVSSPHNVIAFSFPEPAFRVSFSNY